MPVTGPDKAIGEQEHSQNQSFAKLARELAKMKGYCLSCNLEEHWLDSMKSLDALCLIQSLR